MTGIAKKSQSGAATALQPDNANLSPFAQITTELQQLQQSDPTKYQQVTAQIATNLQGAAQTAQASGNTSAANQLNQLATDFQNASTSGQLPNFQDLAQAAGGHHHHHHGGGEASATQSNGASSETLSQLLAGFQASDAQSDSLNPMNIILNTLSTSGIGGSSGS